MKKFLLSNILLLAVVAFVLAAACTSCGGSQDPFFKATGVNVMDQKYISDSIQLYHQKDAACTKKCDSMNVYIDFSFGLNYAYTDNPNNRGMIDAIAQKLTGDVKWYKVGNNTIEPMPFPNTELYNKVVDVKSYSSTEDMAPIEKTIKEIVEENQDALFVTDFEEYTADKTEQFLGFAKQSFIDWLKQGNTIDFYITDYKEKCKGKRTVDKHLYFIIFSTPAQQLKSKIDFALKDRNFTYQTFNLSRDFFSLTNEYPSADKGGIYYDQDGKDIVFQMNEELFKNNVEEHFEYYPFLETWENIYVNSKGQMEEEIEKPFTHVFRNLFINLKNDDIYIINGLSVKVYDVTDDYTFFAQANEAKNHIPTMTEDGSVNKIVDEENSDAIALYCYDEQGNLRSEWNYSPKQPKELKDIFDLDQQLFDNSKKTNPEKTEIGVVYHPNFTGNMPNPGGLLRVDIVVDKCEPNFGKLSTLFEWESSTKEGERNRSLSESIRNTLDDKDINPTGRVIYTYYIKTME